MVGASAASWRTRAISVLPSANDSAPCTNTSVNRATGRWASTARAGQPMSSKGPATATTGPGLRSDSRPATVTPTKEPAPKSTRATDTHSSSSPALSVTTGARKVRPPKVAAFTSAPSSITRISRGRVSRPSSVRSAGLPVSSCASCPAGMPPRMPTAAGRHRTATAQKVACQPSSVPSTAPPGTPAIVASVVPDSSTAKARPFLSGGTREAAAVRATARNPAFASAATTRVENRRAKLVDRAPTAWAAAKARRKPTRAGRLGQLRADAATRGAPTIMPAA